MKGKIRYYWNNRHVEKEVNYIPVRYYLAMSLALLETAAIIGIVVALSYYVPYFYLLVWATQIACVIRIIASDDNPDYKIPWLLVMLVVPVAGFMLYFLFYSRMLKKKYVRRMEDLKNHSYKKDDAAAFEALSGESAVACSQANMLCKIAETHLFTDTRQTYFPLGEEMHHSMLENLRKAEHFIFMEYFIIEEGLFWNSILEILKEKAAQGVEVKVVYDDIGCISTLPGYYFRTLRSYGIDATPFSVLRGNADSEFNNRSHRKIMVIDGKIGYTGGVNIADEYINAVVKYGHWKDIGIRLEGDAVKELTKLFLLDYGLNVKKPPEVYDHFFPEVAPSGEPGYMIPFGDGPNPIYNRLLEAGVSIYEYEPGFIHAKCYLADDETAMIGTINLDYRSLVHHFENGVWMYRCASIEDMKQDFSNTLAVSLQVDAKTIKTNLLQKVVRSLVKIFAPLL